MDWKDFHGFSLFGLEIVSSQKLGEARAGLLTVPGVARSGEQPFGTEMRPQPRNTEMILEICGKLENQCAIAKWD